MAILLSDKIDFKSKTVTWDKGHYIITKGSIHWEDITIVNIHAPGIRAPKYIKLKLTELKGEIDSNTIFVGNFNTHFQQWIHRSDRKSIRIGLE